MATAPVEKSVCKTRASSKTGTIEWQIDAWSSLPAEHYAVGGTLRGLTKSETMQAAGDKWSIHVVPGGVSMPSETEATVQHLKEHGIAHRDVKLDNVMLAGARAKLHPGGNYVV